MTGVQLTVKPQEFFRDRVATAASSLNLPLSDDLEFYVVNLLCDFINPAKLEESLGKVDVLETPLAFLLKNAVEAPPQQQMKMFKALGDTSLYVSGFFQDYFNRKTFDISYYVALGQNAYSNVSGLLREQVRSNGLVTMYSELTDKFEKLVDIIGHVSDSTAPAKPLDALAVYDRWTRMDSERLRRTLEEAGIHPIPTSMKIAQ